MTYAEDASAAVGEGRNIQVVAPAPGLWLIAVEEAHLTAEGQSGD